MDTTAELNSQENSSSAASAANAGPPESIEVEGGDSERAVPSISAPDKSTEPAATPNDSKGAAPGARLELISFFEPQKRAPTVEAAAAKSPRSFVVPGLVAAFTLLFLLGAGAVYERMHETALLASKVQENEHLVSTVSNLTERLDTIEASRAREETADVRKVLGELKQSASATRDVSAAVTQLATRLDRVEHEQSARLDKLGERIDHESSARLADLAARVDKLEKKAALPAVVAVAPTPPKSAPAPDVSAAIAQLTGRVDKLADRIEHDASARFADLSARMDKLEKNAAPATLASAAPTPPSKPAAAPAKPDATVSNETTGSIDKPHAPLRGYAVVGVGDGFAVIEGREGSMQVAPGDMIPGLGRVLRVERRGREWDVVTSAGVIGGGAGPY
jgi:hypothetical protein